MRPQCTPCAHLQIKVRVQRGPSTKIWREWRHEALWPTSVRWCGGALGFFRASDPLACPREYGWTPPWRDCPALWRLALGRNGVSDVMIYTDVMNRPGVGMRRSYRTLGLDGVVPRALLWAGMRCPVGTWSGGVEGWGWGMRGPLTRWRLLTRGRSFGGGRQGRDGLGLAAIRV